MSAVPAVPQSTSLKIGPIEVDPPVVLAPMAGVTNTAFRRICRSFGGGLYVSEMVTARAVVEANQKTMRLLTFADDETPRSAQLYGVSPKVMGLAVRRLVDEIGVDHVDLNFGCPVTKVTRRGGGAALPLHGNLFTGVVSAAVEAAGAVPVTVKMRMGVDDSTLTYLEAGARAEAAGAAAVTLHARTAERYYAPSADWTAIARLKEAVTSIPVLGNGDIWSGDDAVRMMRETGCDGVVVGRGCLGRPWLFRDLDLALRGEPVPDPPTLGEVADIARRHVRLLAELMGESKAVVEFRKHFSWYLTGYPVGGNVRRAVQQIATLADLDERLDDVAARFGELGPVDPALPRGPSNGPRRITLPYGWLETRDSPDPPEGAELLASGG